VRLAELYRQRWTIETLFLVLTKALDCEQERLGYPKAALFAFCVALAAYNVLATVKAALRVVHGSAKVEHEVSLFGVVEEIQRHYSGMLVAFPAEEWQVYQDM